MIDRATWAEIDLSAISANARSFKAVLAPGARLCAVVKANGYGHGAAAVARAALGAGASWLAVAFVDEAVELRRQGFREPILVLGYTGSESMRRAVLHGLSITVVSLDNARLASREAAAAGVTARLHLKIDTGMCRLGVQPGEAASVAADIASLPGVELEGVFSHFASSDSPDPAFADEQFAAFSGALAAMAERGVRPRVRHMANSAALATRPGTHLDMARLGIAMYGLGGLPGSVLPAMALRSRVAQLRTIAPGTTVGYGRKFSAPRPTRVAVLPVGYADGLSRALSNRGSAGFDGGRAPIIGNVCMDQCMVDVTDLPLVREGSVATLMGPGGPSLGEVAALLGTIDYEVACAVSARVPRVYIGGDDGRA